MSRSGGNPELKHFQFTTDRDEPLTEKITVRISTSMLYALKQQDNYREFVRQAIEEKLIRETGLPMQNMNIS